MSNDLISSRRACERPIRTCIVFLDHVQNLQIHAVRAKILMSFFCMNM